MFLIHQLLKSQPVLAGKPPYHTQTHLPSTQTQQAKENIVANHFSKRLSKIVCIHHVWAFEYIMIHSSYVCTLHRRFQTYNCERCNRGNEDNASISRREYASWHRWYGESKLVIITFEYSSVVYSIYCWLPHICINIV